MSTSALYRALDFAYRHPPTLHPVTGGRQPAAAGHSCQPAVLEQRRRTAQLRHFLGADSAASAAAAAAPEPAAASSTSGSGSGCAGRSQPPPPPPSRLSRLAAAVRESRQKPCVQSADLDQALTAAHPLHETARRLLARVKEDNKLLQMPVARRVGSSATGGDGRSLAPGGRSMAPGGRSLAPGGRRGLLGSASAAGDDRERRRRMFSMLYQ